MDGFELALPRRVIVGDRLEGGGAEHDWKTRTCVAAVGGTTSHLALRMTRINPGLLPVWHRCRSLTRPGTPLWSSSAYGYGCWESREHPRPAIDVP